MLKRFVALAIVAASLASAATLIGSSPASACSHHERYDGA